MSIKTMTRVWDNSEAEGSKLLLLLAIADFADDNGVAWPGQAKLAAKSRLAVSSVKRLVAELETDGELWRSRRRKGGPNAYIITIGLSLTQVEEACELVLALGCNEDDVDEFAKRYLADYDQVLPAIPPGTTAMIPDPSSSVIDPPKRVSKTNPPPLDIEDSFDVSYYYRDKDNVKVLGKVSTGPWAVECYACGNEVIIDTLDKFFDCPNGDKRFVLTKIKPQIEKSDKPPPVDIYYRIAAAKVRYGSLDEIWEQDIADTVKDLDRWRTIVHRYCSMQNWNPRNVANMLDYYREDRLPGTRRKKEEPEPDEPEVQVIGIFPQHDQTPITPEEAAELAAWAEEEGRKIKLPI